MSAVGSKGTSKDNVNRQCVEMSAEFANCKKKQDGTISPKHCTLGESQRATYPGCQHTKYTRSRHTGGRTPQYTAHSLGVLVFNLVLAVDGSPAAAGDVVVVGNRRWWRDVWYAVVVL